MAAGASLYLTPDSAATFRTKYAIPDTVQARLVSHAISAYLIACR